MAENVIVAEHAGWPERRKARLVPWLETEYWTLVRPDGGDIASVPSRNVFTPEGLRYAEEWAAKTGKSIYDIRIPNTLRVR